MQLALVLAAAAAVGIAAAQTAPQSAPPPQQKPATRATGAAETKSAPAKKPARKRVITDLAGFDLLGSSEKTVAATVVGGTRGGLPGATGTAGAPAAPAIAALAPKLATLYGSTPIFEWSTQGTTRPEASGLVFILSDSSQREVFHASVTGTRFRYPANAPALDPSRTYYWTVVPAGSTQPLRSVRGAGLAGFVMVSAEQREEIEAELAQIKSADAYESGVARARVFTKYRLWYDAIAAYTDLIAQHPGRGVLYEERGMIYAQLAATQALAEQDFARADSLPPNPQAKNPG